MGLELPSRQGRDPTLHELSTQTLPPAPLQRGQATGASQTCQPAAMRRRCQDPFSTTWKYPAGHALHPARSQSLLPPAANILLAFIYFFVPLFGFVF